MMYFPCPSLGISHFSKSPGSSYWEIWHLEAKVWVPGELTNTRARKHMCINMCIHSDIYMNIYFCIFCFYFVLFLIYMPLWHWETRLHYLKYIYLFDQSLVCNPFPPLTCFYKHISQMPSSLYLDPKTLAKPPPNMWKSSLMSWRHPHDPAQVLNFHTPCPNKDSYLALANLVTLAMNCPGRERNRRKRKGKQAYTLK